MRPLRSVWSDRTATPGPMKLASFVTHRPRKMSGSAAALSAVALDARQPQPASAGGAGSMVWNVLDHRVRPGDQRVRRRRAVARVWRGRGRALCQAGCRRRRDAGVRQSPVRSESDRAARTGSVARRSRQAHHRRRRRTRYPASRGHRREGPIGGLHGTPRHRPQLRSQRPRASGWLRRPRHRHELLRSGQHARQRRSGQGDGGGVPERQGLDGRAAHGRARRRSIEGRRHARHAVRRSPRRQTARRRTPRTPSSASSICAWTMRRIRSRSCAGC